MRAELAELHRQLRTTFVYVTHDQAEAMTMSSRIAVMIGGELVQVGRPARSTTIPRDIRVAEFVGSPKINFAARPRPRRWRPRGARARPAADHVRRPQANAASCVRPERIELGGGPAFSGTRGASRKSGRRGLRASRRRWRRAPGWWRASTTSGSCRRSEALSASAFRRMPFASSTPPASASTPRAGRSRAYRGRPPLSDTPLPSRGDRPPRRAVRSRPAARAAGCRDAATAWWRRPASLMC